eukprot:3467943-Amphidinium_carterae.2
MAGWTSGAPSALLRLVRNAGTRSDNTAVKPAIDCDPVGKGNISVGDFKGARGALRNSAPCSVGSLRPLGLATTPRARVWANPKTSRLNTSPEMTSVAF